MKGSLWLPLRPREHGAYAMVAFPVLSGLILGGSSPGGAAFGVLAAVAFLGHESVNVLLGGRGARVRASLGARARASLVPLGVVALGAAGILAATAPVGALRWAALPALLGTAVLGLTVAGRIRSLPGELVVAATFASTHLPVAAAGGADGAALGAPPLVWLAAFALATLTVHSLKFRFKGRGAGRWAVPTAPVLAAAVLVLGVAAPLLRPDLLALAALVPAAVVPLGVSVALVHPRHLRRLGWTLVGVDTLTLAVLALLVAG